MRSRKKRRASADKGVAGEERGRRLELADGVRVAKLDDKEELEKDKDSDLEAEDAAIEGSGVGGVNCLWKSFRCRTLFYFTL